MIASYIWNAGVSASALSITAVEEQIKPIKILDKNTNKEYNEQIKI